MSLDQQPRADGRLSDRRPSDRHPTDRPPSDRPPSDRPRLADQPSPDQRQPDAQVEQHPASDLGAHRHLVVSERLRERRRALGLTQKEVVARLRRMGVCTTNKALSSLEHGAGLDVAKLPELACALECTLTYLVGLTDTPDHWHPDRSHWPTPVTPQADPAVHVPAPRRPAPTPRLPRIIGPLPPD